MKDLLEIAQKNVTLDTTFAIKDLVDLGTQFRTFDPDNLVSFTPVSTGMFVGAASVLQLNQAASQPMFDVFRGLRPIPSSSNVEPAPVPGPTPGQPSTTSTTLVPSPPTTAGITTTTLSEFIPKVPEGQTCS